MGHLLAKTGLNLDTEKIRAVQNMTQPSNTKELKTFSGFIQYGTGYSVAKFLPNMADISAPLTEKVCCLISGRCKFGRTWNCAVPRRKICCKCIQSIIINTAEIAEIEKAASATIFGTSKFHQFLFGKQIFVTTDHKPLEYIFTKPLYQTSLSLQKMLLTLQRYDLKIVYKPGKELFIVLDALNKNILMK